MPKKNVSTDEFGHPDDEGLNPDIVQLLNDARIDGTLHELIDWNAAVEEARLREEAEAKAASECSRLACTNPPAITCPFCGTNYCEKHPPANEPLNTCDKCGLDLHLKVDPFEQAMKANLAKQAEKERIEQERKIDNALRRKAALEKKQAEEAAARKALEDRMRDAAEQKRIKALRQQTAQAERIARIKEEQARLIEEHEAAKEAAKVEPPSSGLVLEVPED